MIHINYTVNYYKLILDMISELNCLFYFFNRLKQKSKQQHTCKTKICILSITLRPLNDKILRHKI